MLLVQLGINNTRDVWKFCQIGLAAAARLSIKTLVLSTLGAHINHYSILTMHKRFAN